MPIWNKDISVFIFIELTLSKELDAEDFQILLRQRHYYNPVQMRIMKQKAKKAGKIQPISH